jgi:hypothetical protein
MLGALESWISSIIAQQQPDPAAAHATLHNDFSEFVAFQVPRFDFSFPSWGSLSAFMINFPHVNQKMLIQA